MKLGTVAFSNVEISMNIYEDNDYYEFVHESLDFIPDYFLGRKITTFAELFGNNNTISFTSRDFCFEISKDSVENIAYNSYQYFVIIEIDDKLYALNIMEDD